MNSGKRTSDEKKQRHSAGDSHSKSSGSVSVLDHGSVGRHSPAAGHSPGSSSKLPLIHGDGSRTSVGYLGPGFPGSSLAGFPTAWDHLPFLLNPAVATSLMPVFSPQFMHHGPGSIFPPPVLPPNFLPPPLAALYPSPGAECDVSSSGWSAPGNSRNTSSLGSSSSEGDISSVATKNDCRTVRSSSRFSPETKNDPRNARSSRFSPETKSENRSTRMSRFSPETKSDRQTRPSRFSPDPNILSKRCSASPAVAHKMWENSTVDTSDTVDNDVPLSLVVTRRERETNSRGSSAAESGVCTSDSLHRASDETSRTPSLDGEATVHSSNEVIGVKDIPVPSISDTVIHPIPAVHVDSQPLTDECKSSCGDEQWSASVSRSSIALPPRKRLLRNPDEHDSLTPGHPGASTVTASSPSSAPNFRSCWKKFAAKSNVNGPPVHRVFGGKPMYDCRTYFQKLAEAKAAAASKAFIAGKGKGYFHRNAGKTSPRTADFNAGSPRVTRSQSKPKKSLSPKSSPSEPPAPVRKSTRKKSANTRYEEYDSTIVKTKRVKNATLDTSGTLQDEGKDSAVQPALDETSSNSGGKSSHKQSRRRGKQNRARPTDAESSGVALDTDNSSSLPAPCANDEQQSAQPTAAVDESDNHFQKTTGNTSAEEKVEGPLVQDISDGIIPVIPSSATSDAAVDNYDLVTTSSALPPKFRHFKSKGAVASLGDLTAVHGSDFVTDSKVETVNSVEADCVDIISSKSFDCGSKSSESVVSLSNVAGVSDTDHTVPVAAAVLSDSCQAADIQSAASYIKTSHSAKGRKSLLYRQAVASEQESVETAVISCSASSTQPFRNDCNPALSASTDQTRVSSSIVAGNIVTEASVADTLTNSASLTINKTVSDTGPQVEASSRSAHRQLGIFANLHSIHSNLEEKLSCSPAASSSPVLAANNVTDDVMSQELNGHDSRDTHSTEICSTKTENCHAFTESAFSRANCVEFSHDRNTSESQIELSEKCAGEYHMSSVTATSNTSCRDHSSKSLVGSKREQAKRSATDETPSLSVTIKKCRTSVAATSNHRRSDKKLNTTSDVSVEEGSNVKSLATESVADVLDDASHISKTATCVQSTSSYVPSFRPYMDIVVQPSEPLQNKKSKLSLETNRLPSSQSSRKVRTRRRGHGGPPSNDDNTPPVLEKSSQAVAGHMSTASDSDNDSKTTEPPFLERSIGECTSLLSDESTYQRDAVSVKNVTVAAAPECLQLTSSSSTLPSQTQSPHTNNDRTLRVSLVALTEGNAASWHPKAMSTTDKIVIPLLDVDAQSPAANVKVNVPLNLKTQQDAQPLTASGDNCLPQESALNEHDSSTLLSKCKSVSVVLEKMNSSSETPSLTAVRQVTKRKKRGAASHAVVAQDAATELDLSSSVKVTTEEPELVVQNQVTDSVPDEIPTDVQTTECTSGRSAKVRHSNHRRSGKPADETSEACVQELKTSSRSRRTRALVKNATDRKAAVKSDDSSFMEDQSGYVASSNNDTTSLNCSTGGWSTPNSAAKHSVESEAEVSMPVTRTRRKVNYREDDDYYSSSPFSQAANSVSSVVEASLDGHKLKLRITKCVTRPPVETYSNENSKSSAFDFTDDQVKINKDDISESTPGNEDRQSPVSARRRALKVEGVRSRFLTLHKQPVAVSDHVKCRLVKVGRRQWMSVGGEDGDDSSLERSTDDLEPSAAAKYQQSPTDDDGIYTKQPPDITVVSTECKTRKRVTRGKTKTRNQSSVDKPTKGRRGRPPKVVESLPKSQPFVSAKTKHLEMDKTVSVVSEEKLTESNASKRQPAKEFIGGVPWLDDESDCVSERAFVAFGTDSFRTLADEIKNQAVSNVCCPDPASSTGACEAELPLDDETDNACCVLLSPKSTFCVPTELERLMNLLTVSDECRVLPEPLPAAVTLPLPRHCINITTSDSFSSSPATFLSSVHFSPEVDRLLCQPSLRPTCQQQTDFNDIVDDSDCTVIGFEFPGVDLIDNTEPSSVVDKRYSDDEFSAFTACLKDTPLYNYVDLIF